GDSSRGWDFGMVDNDYVAFPICVPTSELYWSSGQLNDLSSYWHERNWLEWERRGAINYFPVSGFRATPYQTVRIKGVTEGSETSITWPAIFSNRSGRVTASEANRVTIQRSSDGHRY